MSREDAQAFADALEADKTLYNWVESTNEAVLHVARKAGFDVTREELTRVLADKMAEGGSSTGGDPSTTFFSERPGR